MHTFPFILGTMALSLVTFLPYVLLALYPFRKNLRSDGIITAAITVVTTTVQLICDLTVALDVWPTPGYIKLAVLLIQGLAFLLLVSAPLTKKLFTLLTLTNLALLVSAAVSALETLLFAGQTASVWMELLLTLLLELLILLPSGLVFFRFLAPAMNRPGLQNFQILWLLPLGVDLLCLVFTALNLPSLLFLLLTLVLTAAVLVAASVISSKTTPAPQSRPRHTYAEPASRPVASKPQQVQKKAVPQPKETPAPRPAPKAAPVSTPDSVQSAPALPPQLQDLQHANLMERISESDQFHHELCRHVDALAYRLEHHQFEKLHLHIHALQEQLEAEARVRHCENQELNNVISFFTRMAGYCGARFTTNLLVDSTPVVSLRDLTILLGNLLDQALDTCKTQLGYDRRIFAAVRQNGSALYLSVEHTCDAAVSENHPGMEICRQIAAHYQGSMESSCTNGVHKTTILLRQPGTKPAANQILDVLYANLLERVAESDQFHRELCRHVDAMAYRVERKQYEKLQLHIHALQEQFSHEQQITHCSNEEVNSLIAYFNRMAGYCGAQVITNLQIPVNSAVSIRNLTVMLGNLLDNALESCKNQSSFDRRIYTAVRMNGSSLYLTVENTCDAANESNIAVNVCKQIAALYRGTLETSTVNGIFKATAILRP